MRHWRGRAAGFVVGLLLGGWLIATPAAQSYVWGAINGIPFGPGLVLSGPILAPDGSATAPSYSFASETNSGWYRSSANNLNLSIAGTSRLTMMPWRTTFTPASVTGLDTYSGFNVTQTLNTTGVIDGVFRVAVTNTAVGAGSYLARFLAGAAGATHMWGVDFAGLATSPAVGTVGTNGQLSAVRQATVAVTCSSGATCTAANLIPAGSLVLGVDTRVTTLITGATSYSIGDGTDADRWGAGIAVAAGTTSGIANFTIASPVYYAAATSIVLTAAGSDFTAGVIRITVHYISITPATS